MDTSLGEHLHCRVVLLYCMTQTSFFFYTGEVKYTEDEVLNVAVKILKEDASRETREDFKREVNIMSSFEHDNILRLIGIVAIGRYLYTYL